MYWKDLAERVAATFLQVVIAALALSGAVGLNWPGTLAVAGSAALLALSKGLLARLVGDPDSASMIGVPPP